MAAKKKVATKKRPATKKKPVAPKKPAHPLKLNDKEWDRDKVMDHLCDEFATSSRGLGSIIIKARVSFGDFPSYSTVMKWLDDDERLSERYAHAREAQADFMADETIEIADDGRNDWMEENDDEGNVTGYKLNGEHVQRSKLRIDARKWMASKLKAKKYGNKLEVDGSTMHTVIVKNLTGSDESEGD